MSDQANKTFVAEAESIDFIHTVVVVQAQHDRANYIVESGVEPVADYSEASNVGEFAASAIRAFRSSSRA